MSVLQPIAQIQLSPAPKWYRQLNVRVDQCTDDGGYHYLHTILGRTAPMMTTCRTEYVIVRFSSSRRFRLGRLGTYLWVISCKSNGVPEYRRPVQMSGNFFVDSDLTDAYGWLIARPVTRHGQCLVLSMAGAISDRVVEARLHIIESSFAKTCPLMCASERYPPVKRLPRRLLEGPTTSAICYYAI